MEDKYNLIITDADGKLALEAKGITLVASYNIIKCYADFKGFSIKLEEGLYNEKMSNL